MALDYLHPEERLPRAVELDTPRTCYVNYSDTAANEDNSFRNHIR